MASYFFSEMPYAAILSPSYLPKHCSHCFSTFESMTECGQGCKEVVYCSDWCMEIDQPWHENECLAYRNGQTRPKVDYNDIQVRLAGRMLARLWKDQGKAVLSEDFPRHLAKDRHFKRLLAHTQELKKLPMYEDYQNCVLEDFTRFFSGTPLAKVKPGQLSNVLNVSKINGFSITCLLSDNPRDLVDLGEGVYLNASRFNHSCVPDIVFSFSGSRLVVRLLEKYKAIAGDKSSKSRLASMSKREFKDLKLNYGFGSSWNHYSALSCTFQRQQSLKDRYFFKCCCPLCRDKRSAKLQMDASIVECDSCKQPYLWKKKSGKWTLKKKCKCPKVDPLPKWIEDSDVQSNVDWLNSSWDYAMILAGQAKDSSTISNALKSVLPSVRKYWHPTWNLRLGQTYEKVMYAWDVKAAESESTDGDQSEEILKSFLTAGELMLKSYLTYSLPWDLTMAVLMHRLARWYLKVKDDDGSSNQRASQLCKMAAEIWRQYGDFGCEKFLLAKAQAIKIGDHQIDE